MGDIMKKLLALLLLSPLAFAELDVGEIKSVESTCNYYFSSVTDIKKCKESFKTADSLSEVYLPKGAEMKTPNELKSAGKSVVETPYTAPKKLKVVTCKTNDYACKERVSKGYQEVWKDVLVNTSFELTSNKVEWFGFFEDGQLTGYTYSTDTDDKGEAFGFNMNGAWEMSSYSYSTIDYAYVDLFAGKLQCTYKVSKKGKLFWFEQKKANYNNVCPSMLMSVYQGI
jgi:hypothetical protein